MFRRIYRQRRRLIFGTVFGTLALMLTALEMNGTQVIADFSGWIGLVALGLTTLIVALGVFVVSALAGC